MYNILICDDDPEISIYIQNLVKEYFQSCLFSYESKLFSNGSTLLSHLASLPANVFTIVLMDIELAQESGIATARQIQQEYPLTRMIFVTGYTEYIQDAFTVDPDFYLLKPIKRTYFDQALSKAIQVCDNQLPKKIPLVFHKEVCAANILDITYIESSLRLLTVHQLNSKFSIQGKLKDLYRLLPNYFLHCQQSYLVNMHFIEYIKNGRIYLTDKTEITISRPKINFCKDAFLQFSSYYLFSTSKKRPEEY